jgi:hypothetical protein
VRKDELFKMAMKVGLYKKLEWCIRAFSMVNEHEDDWKKDPYELRLVNHHTGHYYVNNKQLVLIEDAVIGQPIYQFSEHLQLVPGDVPMNIEAIETSYGNLLFNWIVMVYAFGSKLPYQTGTVKVGKLEDIILKKFEDDPEDPSKARSDTIYVSEGLKYSEAMDYLRSFSQLCVWSITEKTMLPPPGVEQFKAKLLKENKGHLNELATIAKIDAQLVAYDAEWLKGDPGEKFLGDGKSRNIVRKKKFLMHGAEVGLDSNAVTGVLIENSLSQGWDISKFADMNNSLRAGSYGRGAQTQLGGVSVKWLLRASANLSIAGDDCGAKIGTRMLVTEEERAKLVGFTIIENKHQIHITDADQAGMYLGKVVMVRNPRHCQLDHTDYCKVCLGDRLSINPTGLSVAVSEYGTRFMLASMKLMHGKQLAVQKLDINEFFT